MNKVILIGSGNVATSLAFALNSTGNKILQVYSRNIEHAKLLAEKVNAAFINTLKEVSVNADIYIICVPDKIIHQIVSELPPINGIVVHTSGSTDISILSNIKSKGYGVFYPFQTFSKDRIIPFNDIPICLEADKKETFDSLNNIATLLGNNIISMNSTTRTWLHLTGVFTNNFTNHLLSISYKIANDKGFNFDLIKPLLQETIQKAMTENPAMAQTGPAVRFDQTTINLHIEKLKDYAPELAEIYKELSLSIQNFTKK